jgi:RsiW-degrading membrane proteinase PrsW (M82 family)
LVSDRLLFALAVGLGSFLGPILFAAWVRNQERYHREPWTRVGLAFAWGATGAVVMAIVLSLLVTASAVPQPIGVSSALFGAVIVAPVVEEATKGLGLRWVKDEHVELEDGLVYGAAAGLGFSATENIVYGVSAYLEGGLPSVLWTVGLRTFTSSLLHASASALIGYALWRRRAGAGGVGLGVAGFYGAAVLLHSMFNVAASAQLVITFVAGLALAIGGFSWVRRRVRELDRSPPF